MATFAGMVPNECVKERYSYYVKKTFKMSIVNRPNFGSIARSIAMFAYRTVLWPILWSHTSLC